MTIEEVNSKATVLRFPPVNDYFVPEGYKVVDLPEREGMKYADFDKNTNHFVPEYHKEVVIPTLEKILNFKVDESFVWETIPVKGTSAYLGRYKPSDPFKYAFLAEGITRPECVIATFSDLVTPHPDDPEAATPYHKLFRYPHQCSRIVNLTQGVERRLLLCADSQLIPEVPLLCCLFKEVWYLDKRSGSFSCQELFSDVEFTDVLFELGGQTFSAIQERLL